MNRAIKTCVWIGGIALIAATFVDTIAVIGRQIGVPFTGSIELMQAIVLISGAVGLLIATVENCHARVRVLIDRASAGQLNVLERLSDGVTFLFLLAVLGGSLWLASDLWNGAEESETLRVPWLALRLIANVCLLAICAVLLARVVRGADHD